MSNRLCNRFCAAWPNCQCGPENVFHELLKKWRQEADKYDAQGKHVCACMTRARADELELAMKGTPA